MTIETILITKNAEGYVVSFGEQTVQKETKGGVIIEVSKILAYEEFVEIKEDITGLFSVSVDTSSEAHKE